MRRELPDCYAYVRRFYGVAAYIGVRVSAGGRAGVLVSHKGNEHYVYIRFDGDARITGPFHPTDGIAYNV